MKKITIEQINTVLSTVYQTNIPAQAFDELKKFFSNLPTLEEQKPDPDSIKQKEDEKI
jgi:hypothetical protein